MSGAPGMRRQDLAMSDERALQALEQGFSGWLATMGEDGDPYCTPMLYVCMDAKVYLHSTRAKGLLRTNIDRHAKVCFGVGEPDQVYAYQHIDAFIPRYMREWNTLGLALAITNRQNRL